MKKLIAIIFAGSLLTLSNEVRCDEIVVKPYGYVGYEILYDTYRSVETRDGELYLFPRKAQYDAMGNNIHERSKLNMLSLQSRFGFTITGAEVWGAKLSAKIEGDFFATQQEYTRLFRMRIASMNIAWPKTQLLMGHDFHPTFVLDCFPGTLSFAAAAPFHPLNRSSQIRVTRNLTSSLQGSLSMHMHTYHISAGPLDAQRNSGLPETVGQLRFTPKPFLLIGFTGGYKFLSPRDVTTGNVATQKTVGSYHVQGFTRITTQPVTLKLEAVYGENLTHFVMIGGYGAKGVDTNESPFNWEGDYDYANLKTLSLWADLYSNNKVLQWGVFAGYTENLGSDDQFLKIPALAKWDDLHNLFRISPRLVYYSGKFSMGLECSYYSAVFASEVDEYYQPTVKMDPVENYHIVFLTKYTF